MSTKKELSSCPYWNSPTFPAVFLRTAEGKELLGYEDSPRTPEEYIKNVQAGFIGYDPMNLNEDEPLFTVEAMINQGWLEYNLGKRLLFVKKAGWEKQAWLMPLDSLLIKNYPDKVQLFLNICLSDVKIESQLNEELTNHGFVLDQESKYWTLPSLLCINLNKLNVLEERGSLSLSIKLSNEVANLLVVEFEGEAILKTHNYVQAQECFNSLLIVQEKMRPWL